MQVKNYVYFAAFRNIFVKKAMGMNFMPSFTELEKKQVINVTNGKLLGSIKDAVIDESGKIVSIVVVKKKPLFAFKEKDISFSVKWEDVTSHSDDVVLVKTGIEFPTKKEEALQGWGFQGYIAIGLLLLSLFILIKSCTG